MQVRRLVPVATAVLLAAAAAVLAPLGDSSGARALLGLGMLVIALPGLAAFDGVLRLTDRMVEQAQTRAEESERLRREVRELGSRHDEAVASTFEQLDRVARDLTATRAYARGARDDLVSVQERLATLERGLGAVRASVAELIGSLAGVARDAAAGREESAAAREDAAAARDAAVSAREQSGAAHREATAARAELLSAGTERAGLVQAVRAAGSEAAAGRSYGEAALAELSAVAAELAALRTALAALRAEIDARAEGVEATTVRMTLPLVRAAFRREPGPPAGQGLRDRDRVRRAGDASA